MFVYNFPKHFVLFLSLCVCVSTILWLKLTLKSVVVESTASTFWIRGTNARSSLAHNVFVRQCAVNIRTKLMAVAQAKPSGGGGGGEWRRRDIEMLLLPDDDDDDNTANSKNNWRYRSRKTMEHKSGFVLCVCYVCLGYNFNGTSFPPLSHSPPRELLGFWYAFSIPTMAMFHYMYYFMKTKRSFWWRVYTYKVVSRTVFWLCS